MQMRERSAARGGGGRGGDRVRWAGRGFSASRRGLTLLECVLATALLALVAAATMSAVGAIVGNQQRAQLRLGAAELANRLMLQYLDDETAMPSKSLPVQYSGRRYRWEMSETPVEIVPARPEIAQERLALTPMSLNRLKVVRIRVWLSEESGGAYRPDGIAPEFSVSRLIDPIAAAVRNPDSAENMLRNNPDLRLQWLEQFMGARGTSRPTRTAPPRTQNPPTSAPAKESSR